MITLLQSPPDYTFAGNFMPVRFQTDNYAEQAGVQAFNFMYYLSSTDIADGDSFTLTYGSKSYSFYGTGAPDNSGTQFKVEPENQNLYRNVIACLQAHPVIGQDFTITLLGSAIKFLANKAAYSLDFQTDFTGKFYRYNLTPGVPEVLRPNFAIAFNLLVSYDNGLSYNSVYSNRLQLQYGTNGQSSIDIADKLNNLLTTAGPDLPATDGSFVRCEKSVLHYKFTFAESYGDDIQTFGAQERSGIALAGAFSYLGALAGTLQQFIEPVPDDESKNRFLKQGGTSFYTRPDQPQFLTWFNTGSATDYYFKIKFFYIDGTQETFTKYNFNANPFAKYCFPTSYKQVFTQSDHPGKAVERYECWLEGGGGYRATETITYWLNYEHQQFARYFIYWSSFGTLECMCCHGKGSSQFELTQKEAKTIRRSGYRVTDGDSRMFDIKLNTGYKAVTGWINRHQMAGNRDFFLSKFKYRYFKEQLLPIKISSTAIPEYEDGQNNISQEFEYKYLFDDEAYTEGDVETNNVPLQDFIFGGFGRVRIVDQFGNLIEEVHAPGQFQVFRFNAIDGGDAFSVFELQVIKTPND